MMIEVMIMNISVNGVIEWIECIFVGKSGVFLSGGVHSRVLYEDHSLRSVHAFGRLLEKCMESVGLHNSSDRSGQHIPGLSLYRRH